jgi:hypothetical protein
MKKVLLAIGVAVGLAIVGFYLLNSYIYYAKQVGSQRLTLPF